MRNILICCFLLVGTLLSGCGLKTTGTQVGKKKIEASAKINRNMLDMETQNLLNSELMYKILVAEIAGKRGNIPLAVQHYLEAVNLSVDPAIAKRATRLAVFARKQNAALKAAKRWVELSPDNLDALQTVAILYLRAGNHEQAVLHLERVIKLASNLPRQGYLQIAGLLGQEKDKQSALKVMGQLVEKDSNNLNAQFAYSRLALQLEDLDLAYQAIEKTLKIKPDFVSAKVIKARILMRQGKAAQSLAIMKGVVDTKPDSREYRINYARLLAEAKQYGEARDQFEYLLKATPNDAELLYAMALLAIEGKQFDVAEAALKRLLKTGKKTDDAYYYLGSIAEFRKKYDKAIANFSLIQNGERQIDVHFRIVKLLTLKGEIDGARKFLHQLKGTNDELSVRIVLAEIEILNEARQYKEALGIVNKGLQRHPKNNDLFYARSLLAEKLGDMVLAEQDLKSVLASEPDNAHALNALGYMLADRTKRYQEALGYIERALKTNPNEPAFVDSMGWVQYRMGNLDDAARYLRKAFSMFNDSEIAAHLGEVLWMKGERPEAKKIWKRALKDDPDSVHLLDVMKRFLQ